MKKAIMLLALLASVPLLEGCKTRVDFRYGHGYDYNHHHGRGWYHGGHGWYGRRYGGGWRHHDVMAATDATAAATAGDGTEDSVGLLAADYGIKRSAANAILVVASGSEDAKVVMQKIGLTKEDVAPLANMDMPSREAAAKIARGTGLKISTVDRILTDFTKDMK